MTIYIKVQRKFISCCCNIKFVHSFFFCSISIFVRTIYKTTTFLPIFIVWKTLKIFLICVKKKIIHPSNTQFKTICREKNGLFFFFFFNFTHKILTVVVNILHPVFSSFFFTFLYLGTNDIIDTPTLLLNHGETTTKQLHTYKCSGSQINTDGIK